jgi:membrane protease YdiL (CAAX protease family)
MQSLGVLIWLISPLAANLLLRWLGKEGWKDFGISPNLKSGWRWYLVALLTIPVISLVMIGLGALFGSTAVPGLSAQGLSAFLSLLGAGIAGNLVKNLFEEFAWRGYLTPRLEALHANPVVSAIVTGVIWTSWHIPYYLYFLSQTARQSQTSLSVPVLILLAFIILPMEAFAYGELRLLSKSVWPCWLMHTLANAFSFTLVTGGFVILSKDFSSVLLSPGTEGIGYSLLMALTGWGLHQYRMRSLQAGQR